MFGLSKVWSWIIFIGLLVSFAGAAFWGIYKLGEKGKTEEVQQANVKIEEKAVEADTKGQDRYIRETNTIEIRTNEVKEVINATPPSTIDPVSISRAERVWRQQESLRAERKNAASELADVSERTSDSESE